MSSRGRIGILVGLMAVLTLVLVGRIFKTAVLSHDYYLAKAKDQQQIERDVLPRRGTLYVQDTASGELVAVAQSVERFALGVAPRDVSRKAEYAELLAAISGADATKLKDAFDKNKAYIDPIAHGLTKDEVMTVIERVVELERKYTPKFKSQVVNFDPSQGDIIKSIGGVYFVREYQRTYPEGGLLGQSIGFVNDKGKGQYGIEGLYDNELKGYAGKISLESDSYGRTLKQLDQVNGRDGTNYVLTIDRNIQKQIEVELAAEVQKDEAKGGSVIVMDPKTGAVVAMASTPDYRPESFRQVAKDNVSLFDNPAISNIWEPGSIFKPLIMGAAIDKGLVTPSTTDTFAESVSVNGYDIKTALNKAYGRETMTDVLVNSDNVAMVWVGNKLGSQTMYDYIRNYGFGTPTGIDLKNEVGGQVTPLERWSDIVRATNTFGQGIAVTPLQIASAYSAIANNGLLMQPHLVDATLNADGSQTPVTLNPGRQVMKPETSMDLRHMLTQVVDHNHKRAGVEGYKVAGKTGTAQVPDPNGRGYIPDAYNHSFAGMAPADDPKFVLLVKIDQPNISKVGLFAESTAVPLFGRISRFLLHYYQVPPKP